MDLFVSVFIDTYKQKKQLIRTYQPFYYLLAGEHADREHLCKCKRPAFI